MNDEKEKKIKHPNNFIDPYGHIEREDKGRTTIDVALQTRSALSSIYPKKGVLQTTINILLEKLRKELELNGLTSFAPDVYEYAVGNCRIILGGYDTGTENECGTGKPTGKRAKQSKLNPANQVNRRNDRRGTKPVALQNEGVNDAADSTQRA